MDESYYNNTPSGQMDVFKYAKSTSLILNISTVFNFLFAAAALTVAVMVFMRFRELPMIIQEDRGYLEPHEAELFTLQTEHVQAFLERTLGMLRSYDCDKPDFEPIYEFVDDKILTGVGKEIVDSLDKARKFNRRQLWTLKEFRRSYDGRFSSKVLAIAVKGEITNYENSRATARFKIQQVKVVPDYLIAYLVRVPISKKNPWGLILVNFYQIDEYSKFEKSWKESYDPYAPEFNPESDDFVQRFSWSTEWRPRKKKNPNEE